MASWTIALTKEGAETHLVRIDEQFRSHPARANLDTHISVRFSGDRMLQSLQLRGDFEEALESALKPWNGVFVAGIAEQDAYIFHAYARSDGNAITIPVDDAFGDPAAVTVRDDPQWTTYDSYLPTGKGPVLVRLAVWLLNVLSRGRR